jgi:hypothetical protein
MSHNYIERGNCNLIDKCEKLLNQEYEKLFKIKLKN